MIEIPLNDRDLQMLPPLHAYFKSFWSDTGPDPRSKFYRFMAKTPIIDGVLFRRAHGVEPPGLWCQPPCADAKWAILYLHGGAYTMGDANAYRGFVSQISARTQCSAFILDYPLAPEASLPVALDLACTAVEHILAIYPRIAIVGDSAGGGLTLATLATLRASRSIASGVLFSPWTDLTLSGRSVQENALRDVLLHPARLADAARAYVGASPLDDPRASPLFGIPNDLPPLLIQVGSEEVLLDDSLRYAASARKAGAPITLEVWRGMHHVFQFDVKTLVSARGALDRAASFLRGGR